MLGNISRDGHNQPRVCIATARQAGQSTERQHSSVDSDHRSRHFVFKRGRVELSNSHGPLVQLEMQPTLTSSGTASQRCRFDI